MDTGLENKTCEMVNSSKLHILTFWSLAVINGEHRFPCAYGPHAQSFFVMERAHGNEAAPGKVNY
jgi:hypothetical protein